MSVVLLVGSGLGSTGGGEASRRAEASTHKKSATIRFAFDYAPSLTDAEIAWYSQFHLLVTHDPLPREQVEQLHRAGTKLVLYEWAAAFYETRATPWQNSLRERDDLLNDAPLTGGSGSEAPAWYFDPEAHGRERAEDLANRIRDAGYDGVFLDATTVANVHPEAMKQYTRRHPQVPYEFAFSRFLVELRRELPHGVLFTNQGYRSARHYLPYVDWDLSESLISSPTDVRHWNNPGEPANTIAVAMADVAAIAEQYPHVRFGHLNYVTPHATRDVVRLVVGVAQVFGSEGFVASDTRDQSDPIYLRNPGQPLGSRIDLPDGRGAYRIFENGIIAISAGTDEVVIEHKQKDPLRNHVTGDLVDGATITLPSSNGAPRAYFFDRTIQSTPARNPCRTSSDRCA